MENFITPEDSNDLQVLLMLSSDAKLDGPNEVFATIYHIDDKRSYRKVSVEKIADAHYKVLADKKMLKERPVLKIKSFFIVDNVQLTDKDRVIKATKNNYTFKGPPDVDFKSDYAFNKEEYVKGKPTDETFNVTKRVTINFQ